MMNAKIPAQLYGEGSSQELQKLTTLSQYIEYETWTPLWACLLVCGIQPTEGCTEIPNNDGGAIGLDNCFHSGNEDSFYHARRILKLWESRENAPAKVRPADFVAWCKTYDNSHLNKINTDWLREIAHTLPEALEQAANKNTRISVSEQQNSAILNWLQSNNHDPLNMPVPPKGKAGIKKSCGDALSKNSNNLFQSKRVFDTVWQRLRDNQQIKDAK